MMSQAYGDEVGDQLVVTTTITRIEPAPNSADLVGTSPVYG
jgi:hypothetical protein